MSSVDMKEGVIVPMISWIRRELDIPIIVEQPNVPRPNPPYIGLMITTPLIKIGRDNIERPAVAIPPAIQKKDNIGGQRQFTVSVRAYVSPINQQFYDAQNLLIILQDSLEDETRRVELTEAGLAVWVSNAILDTTVELESGFEPRAQFDIGFGIASNRDADLGQISSAEFTGTLNGTKEDSFEVPE